MFSDAYKNMDPEQQDEACSKLFDWMDVDKSGKVTLRELKVSIIKCWHCQCPPGILDVLVEAQPAAEV